MSSCFKTLSNSHKFTRPSVICCYSKMGVVEYSWMPRVVPSPLGAVEGLLFVRLGLVPSIMRLAWTNCRLEPLAPLNLFSKLFAAAARNGNEIKWSEKLESVTFLSSGGHLPVHCRRNNQVSRSSFPKKVNPTYHLCMISVGIDYH